jgi:hypothetical protein
VHEEHRGGRPGEGGALEVRTGQHDAGLEPFVAVRAEQAGRGDAAGGVPGRGEPVRVQDRAERVGRTG